MFDAIVFDAYGTLFDVQSVTQESERLFPGNGSIISRLWRQKQLAYSWLRALMKRYATFDEINLDALRYSLQQIGKEPTDEVVANLAGQYLNLTPFPEVSEALQELNSVPLAILSNGTPSSLTAVVQNAGLESYFEHILSADSVKSYKPDPRVYELARVVFDAPKDQILFVSSNGWDVAGAKQFGFSVAWVNRSSKVQEELGVGPDYVVESLTGLLPVLS